MNRRIAAAAVGIFPVVIPMGVWAGALVSGSDIPGGQFGHLLAVVPDVTRDGRPDIIGAGQYEPVNSQTNEFGKAHVYDGASEQYRFTFQSQDFSGNYLTKFSALAAIADVTGDGRTDFVLGSQEIGKVHIFNGANGTHVRSIVDPPYPGGFGSTSFGSAIATIPDRNGDGFMEIAAGAANGRDVSGDNPEGNVQILSGVNGVVLDILRPPAPAGDLTGFGYSVAAGDVLSNPGTEVLVGAPNTKVGFYEDAGQVHIFSGSTLVQTLQAPDTAFLSFFGWDVALLRRSEEAHADVIVSAPYENAVGGAFSAGRVYVFDASGTSPRLQLESPDPQDGGHFGQSIASIDDVTGDGSPDIAVGAPIEYLPEAAGCGRVHLFDGSTGAFVRTILSPNPRNSGFFGSDLAGLPDQDGDGMGDLVVGAPGDEFGNGRVYIISGATGLLTAPSLRQSIINFVDGLGSEPSGLNANSDNCVDVADAVRASIVQ